jgi:serine/threonine-protein kinase
MNSEVATPEDAVDQSLPDSDRIGQSVGGRNSAGAPGAGGLPPDLLESAYRRLSILSLVVSALLVVNLVVYSLLPLIGSRDPGQPPDLVDLFVLGMLVLSGGVFFLARSRRLGARRLLDLGLVYQVLLAFTGGVAIQLVAGEPQLPRWGISHVCIIILLFPVIVPNTPARTLGASLIAASMDPLGVLLGGWMGHVVPPATEIVVAFHWNYLCAGLAVIPSLVVTGLGREVGKAREMSAYRLIERLGEGAMGEVWRTRHHQLARDAAIKIIQPEKLLAGDEEAARLLQRFEREAQATATLESPYTVELYDFGVTDEGTFFYVMELLDGLDLDSLVRRYGPVPSERAVWFLIQVCHSLADAHARGLMHRDVKPANIFACRKGLDSDFVKVLDFGLVKARPSVVADGATMENAVLGTPAYMPPEMIRGGEEIDGRADLYSLGCVAYWLLTGRLVFDATSPVDVMIQHVNREPEPPSVRSELAVDPALERIVLQCLQKERDDRPHSAAALMTRLEDLPIARAWTPERSWEWWGRHTPPVPEPVAEEVVPV